MLILNRHEKETITIRVGEHSVIITVVEIRNSKVRLGFDADMAVEIFRDDCKKDHK